MRVCIHVWVLLLTSVWFRVCVCARARVRACVRAGLLGAELHGAREKQGRRVGVQEERIVACSHGEVEVELLLRHAPTLQDTHPQGVKGAGGEEGEGGKGEGSVEGLMSLGGRRQGANTKRARSRTWTPPSAAQHLGPLTRSPPSPHPSASLHPHPSPRTPHPSTRGIGYRVGQGCRVLWYRVWGIGYRIYGLEYRVGEG
jgi:hypothetical protein